MEPLSCSHLSLGQNGELAWLFAEESKVFWRKKEEEQKQSKKTFLSANFSETKLKSEFNFFNSCLYVQSFVRNFLLLTKHLKFEIVAKKIFKIMLNFVRSKVWYLDLHVKSICEQIFEFLQQKPLSVLRQFSRISQYLGYKEFSKFW